MALNAKVARAPRAGMIVRSKEILEPGLLLFKLGHRFVKGTRQVDEDVLRSPWWFTAATVEAISLGAESGGPGLSDAFRRGGAIARRWGGSADLVVRARMRASLVAYIGPGTIQDFRSDDAAGADAIADMPLWVPSPSIAQVYIPLGGKGSRGVDVVEAFDGIYLVPIDKWDDGYIRSAPKSKWAM